MSEPLLPHEIQPSGPPPADVVAGPQTDKLVGLTIEYVYTSAREYRLSFTATDVTFVMLDAPNYDPKWGFPVSLPYLAREVRDNLFLVHWMVPGRSGHIAVLIDLTSRQIHVSALMPGKMEFFDIADIHMIAQRASAQSA